MPLARRTPPYFPIAKRVFLSLYIFELAPDRGALHPAPILIYNMIRPVAYIRHRTINATGAIEELLKICLSLAHPDAIEGGAAPVHMLSVQ